MKKKKNSLRVKRRFRYHEETKREEVKLWTSRRS